MAERLVRRRARHDILMEILKAAKGGEKKTRIMQTAQLSFHQLEQYLNASNHALFMVEEAGFCKTTEKGLRVTEACEICLRLTEEVK